MIRCGQLCKTCTQTHCAEIDEQIQIQCPICEGTGCEACNGGHFPLQGCPQTFVRPMVAAIRLSDTFTKNQLPPVAGGSLDQSASFLSFVEQLEHEESRARNDGNA